MALAKLEFFIEPDFSSLKHCCLISQDFLICKSSTLDEKGKKEIQECFNYPISMDHILEVIIFFSSYSYSYFILRLRAQAFTISLMADLRQDRKGVLNIVADVFMEHFLGESGPLRPFSK